MAIQNVCNLKEEGKGTLCMRANTYKKKGLLERMQVGIIFKHEGGQKKRTVSSHYK